MDVFLSYNWQDREFAHALRERLNASGLKVWDPERQLLPGSNWLIETGRALERADSVVFLISNETLRSPWAVKEVEYAVGNQKFEGMVVPVMLSTDVKMPWILNKLKLVDATGRKPDEVADEISRRLKSALRRSESEKSHAVTPIRSSALSRGQKGRAGSSKSSSSTARHGSKR
jgi:hypothetical protein